MSVFGYIRFSYFGRSDTKLSRGTPDDDARFEALYAPDRMETRFFLFEKICLPSLRAQTDQDFRVVVLASHVMPEPYKTRLEALVADIPQVEVMYSDAEHVTYAINPWIADQTATIKENTAHFRLDDDDAISSRMVAHLRERADHARQGEMLSYPQGLYLASYEGKPFLLRKFEPYIAIALTFINRPGEVRNPYQCRHGSHHMLVPSQMDPSIHAYIHTAHAMSDTRTRQNRKLKNAMTFDPHFESKKGRAKIDKVLRKAFPGQTADGLKEIIMNAASEALAEAAPVSAKKKSGAGKTRAA